MVAARVTLRRMGATSGKLIRRPESWEGLLDQARKLLDVSSVRIFVASGDEVEDFDLIEDGDVVYVSEGAPSPTAAVKLTPRAEVPPQSSPEGACDTRTSVCESSAAPSAFQAAGAGAAAPRLANSGVSSSLPAATPPGVQSPWWCLLALLAVLGWVAFGRWLRRRQALQAQVSKAQGSATAKAPPHSNPPQASNHPKQPPKEILDAEVLALIAGGGLGGQGGWVAEWMGG